MSNTKLTVEQIYDQAEQLLANMGFSATGVDMDSMESGDEEVLADILILRPEVVANILGRENDAETDNGLMALRDFILACQTTAKLRRLGRRAPKGALSRWNEEVTIAFKRIPAWLGW